MITNERIWDDPESLRHSILSLLNDYPQEIKEMIKITEANSLSFARLRHHSPWDLLTGTFCNGSVMVAGDAMHVMGLFLGQGGSAGLEDAVVLARNMAHMGLDRVEEAFNMYAKERRMRVVRLSLQTYLTGEEVEVNGFDGDEDLCFYVATIIRLYRLTADVRFRDLKSRNGESLEGAIRMEVLRPKPPVFVYEYKSGDAVEVWIDNRWCNGRFSSFSYSPKVCCKIYQAQNQIGEVGVLCPGRNVRPSQNWRIKDRVGVWKHERLLKPDPTRF
ncbi:hypothetical protein LXL04_039858 [Taraxacum kok-saghyz]